MNNNLSETSARLSFHGRAFIAVSHNAETEVELLWSSAFGAMYRAYYASQVAHWNIESREFSSDHAYFRAQYEFWQETIDNVAEHIRTYDVELPEKLSTFVDSIELEVRTDDLGYFHTYLQRLLQVLRILIKINSKAEEINDVGSIDLVGGLVRDIRKNYWMAASHMPKPDKVKAMNELNAPDVKLAGVVVDEKQ
jgi:starvation-inducible DNA-binding protein